jgi:hypothetical protein
VYEERAESRSLTLHAPHTEGCPFHSGVSADVGSSCSNKSFASVRGVHFVRTPVISVLALEIEAAEVRAPAAERYIQSADASRLDHVTLVRATPHGAGCLGGRQAEVAFQ